MLEFRVFRMLGLVVLAALGGCAPVGEQARGGERVSVEAAAQGWRHARTALFLGAEAPAAGAVPFRFSGLEAARITVPVTSVAGVRLLVRGQCDGAGVVEAETGGERAARGFVAGAPFSFELAPRAREGAVLALSGAVQSCALDVSAGAGVRYTLRLEREERFAPAPLRQLDDARGDCAFPVAAGDALAAVFAGRGGGLSMTCPVAPGTARLLPDAREAFQAKVEALTGARLPEHVMDAGDIEAPIDFSRAPQLDVIYLSSLHMRADFSGYMIARMLAWHAERGTTVRIVLTDSLQLSVDRRIFEELVARYPGIQLQLFRAGGPGQGAEGAFDRVHRANHVKVFATLSSAPGRSMFMIGGRNLHDGFVFERPRDLTRWPFLRTYDPERVFSLGFFFAAYRDLEMVFHDDATVRMMAAHMAAFWHRDHDTQAMGPSVWSPAALRARSGQGVAPDTGGLRHFLSIPYADGRALEALYVAMFDAAQSRIDMVSPFLNLPPRIEAAMERALERGVAIRLLTRIEIPEPATIFVTTLNRVFVETHAERMEIHAHAATSTTLHSKIMVVDGRLAVISSTNLNRRSFWHDTENGVLILDRGQARRVLRLIDTYQRDSLRQGVEQRISPLLRRLLSPRFILQLF